jgi:hypothetical protein
MPGEHLCSAQTRSRPGPHQPAGPGTEELSSVRASDPQVAPSRLGADSARSEVRDRIAASAEPKLSLTC